MLNTHMLRSNIFSLFITAGLVLPANHLIAGGVQSQMDSIFEEMSNATAPGTYETQGRGVISGGRYMVKNKIFDEDLITFDPPSWKAGCGGIDFYGGSMSFISSDKIVTLLRAIAGNAKGYAFQVALNAVSPEIAIWMENFQKKIQQLNQAMGNSCQLAKGLVNGGLDALDYKTKDKTSLDATFKGLFEDPFDARSEKDGKTAAEKAKANDPDLWNKMHGNILWQAFKEHNVQDWFSAGDEKLIQLIMSLTGTVIVQDISDETTAAGCDKEADPSCTPPEPTLDEKKQNKDFIDTIVDMEDLVLGGSFEIFKCADDQCLNSGSPSGKQPHTVDGLEKKIQDSLLGNGSSPGIIYKLQSNQGTLTSDERKFQTSLPAGMGGMIVTLSAVSPNQARMFALEASGAIACYLVYDMVVQFLTAARISIATSDNPHKVEVEKKIDQAQAKIDAEYRDLREIYGSISKFEQSYARTLKLAQKAAYTPPIYSPR